ncbi:unnamed protein product [Somion occarium]|uniref:Zinc-finger domain-containing protein n=1 Tax=Somion occarium TaxID=3059160 RepID=A0ABP1DJ56_9APHY
MSTPVPRPVGLARRRSQINEPSGSSLGTPSASSLKENTPLRPSRTNSDSTSLTTMSSLSSNSHKRKLSLNNERPEVVITSKPPPTKKVKTSATGSQPKLPEQKADSAPPKKAKVSEPSVLTSEEYPNGYCYCHQCNKKRDISLIIRCTKKDNSVNTPNHRCKLRYCSACLNNRYQQNFEEKKSFNGASLSKAKKDQHVSDAGYYWECPRCEGECNCRVCRKIAGLPPLGKLKTKSTDEKPAVDNKAKAKSKPKVTKEKVVPKASTSKSSAKTTGKIATKAKPTAKPIPAPKPKVVPKPKPLPRPLWTRLEVPLQLAQVEDRIAVREFILRFALSLQVSKTHLDELEELIGQSLSSTAEGDDEDVAGWMGEPCMKSILAGLLDVILDFASVSNATKQVGHIKEAAKSIRAAGGSLNKMWSALETLRSQTNVIGSPFRFDLPDPLPPPPSTVYHNTRSGIQGKGVETTVYVACSAQLVPVLVELVDLAIQSPIIREEIDSGVAEEKDLVRDAKDAISKENALWKEVKDTKKVKADLKANRERHKQRLHDLELASVLASHRFAPRYGPLGRDSEGRIYYALSPGMAETDAAIQLIKGKVVKVKFGRKKGGVTIEDRKDMQRWSWFLAVWGRKPEGAEEAKGEDGDVLMDDDSERWWGFWDPMEIHKLAAWLEVKNALGDGSAQSYPSKLTVSRKSTVSRSTTANSVASVSREPSPLSELSSETDNSDEEDEDDESQRIGKPTRKELRTLVQHMRQYADLLQWRVQRALASDEGTPDKDDEPRSSRGRPMPATKFYA